MAEDFQQEAPLTTVDDAVDAIFAASQEQPAEPVSEEADEPEAEELEAVEDDQAEVEAAEEDAEEDDQPEDEEEQQFGDEELFYEIDGEEVSLSQLKEWRKSGLREADYTRKSQANAAEKEQVKAEREAANQERQALATERQQLQAALANLAVDGETEPDWAEMARTKTPQQVFEAQGEWRNKVAQKDQARQAHQQLQAQQSQERFQGELDALVAAKPEWATDAGFAGVREKVEAVAAPLGLSWDQLTSAATIDHRSILVLHELAEVKAKLAEYENTAAVVKKKVVKAEPRRGASQRQTKSHNQSKKLAALNAKARKSGNKHDITDALMATLNSD